MYFIDNWTNYLKHNFCRESIPVKTKAENVNEAKVENVNEAKAENVNETKGRRMNKNEIAIESRKMENEFTWIVIQS